MPIVAYVGLPGHGKSHAVLEHVILPALKAHRTVVTNVALHWDKLRAAYPGCDLRSFDLKAVAANPRSIFEAVPPGSVLVVDEAWELWPAGQSPKDVPLSFKEILAKHRHLVDDRNNSMQVVLVTQDLGQIGKFARDLVEETFRTLKLSKLGMSGKYRVDVFTGPVSGPNPPVARRVRQMGGRYRAEVWQWYQSHTLSQGGEGGANESKVDGRGNIWRSPVWLVGGIVVVAGLSYGVYAVMSFFGSDRPAHVRMNAPQGSNLNVSQAANLNVGRARGSWRVSGYVIDEFEPRRSVAYLTDGAVWVAVSVDRFCNRFLEGFIECRYRGITASSEFVPVVRESAVMQPVVSSLLPGVE